MLRKNVLIYCLLLGTLVAEAQTPLEAALANVKQGSTLPENLLSGRTAVFMKVPPQDSPQHPQHWQHLAAMLHETLVPLQVDAVAYYQWQDLNSGIDATRSFFETLNGREISQVIIVELADTRYSLTIVPTTSGSGFLDSQADTWFSSGEHFEGLLVNLAAAVKSRGLEVDNFLVVEKPEFFVDTGIFKSNRFETFQPDLKLDKLAVPLFGNDNPEDIRDERNEQLQSIMTRYPFKYELVDYAKGEDIFRRAGFQYILLNLYAPEPTLRKLLDYRDDQGNETKMAYKFYVRHIISGDIYLGDQWDADSSWEVALNSFITNLKRSLKVE